MRVNALVRSSHHRILYIVLFHTLALTIIYKKYARSSSYFLIEFSTSDTPYRIIATDQKKIAEEKTERAQTHENCESKAKKRGRALANTHTQSSAFH